MRLPDFFKLGALLILGLAVLKVFFGDFLDTQNQNVIIAFWVLSGIYTVAIIRRGGIINYLEALAVGIIWIVATLVFDFLITGSRFLLGSAMFTHLYIWIGYLVVLACIFFFHKKRHVHIRRGGQVEAHH